MTEAKVIFNLEGIDVTIQCSKNEKMKDICQKYVNKIDKNINSLIFLYGGNQLNFNLNFIEQANRIDKERNVMKILVYKNEDNECICPKCGEKIKLNTEKIDDIILSINNIKDTINGTKSNIDNIIKLSKDNLMNNQLKNVNLILNTLNEDFKKINKKLNDLLNNNKIKNENINNNYIIAEIYIKEEDINKEIRIINSYEESLRINKYINKNLNLNNENEIKNCEIRINNELIPFNYIHKFKSSGKYTIKYSFKNNINNTAYMFYYCELLTNIDLSNFNTNNVTNMESMFWACSALKNINLSNFNTYNITNMESVFNGCSSLKSIDLSNFNTNNVTDMSCMFNWCSSLNSINLSNFNTNNVTNMSSMFDGCSSLNSIDLSNFNTNNVISMSYMFYNCKNLKKENISIKDENSLKRILNQL